MNVILKLVAMLLMPLFAGGFYLAFDFWNVNRIARLGDGDGVSAVEYLSGWVSLGGALTANATDSSGVALPTELLAMLPKAPEGWTVRQSAPSDVVDFLPQGTDVKVMHYVQAVVTERDGNGLRQVRQTYQNGSDIVVFELIRYPDFIFTSFAAAGLKFELMAAGAQFSSSRFMTVRGMEIVEDILPDEVGLRYFVGDVSDQIWVRVLASKPMTDEALLPFFETLHVPAMAGNVIEKQDGMGEVPVIVLASVIDEQTRAALEAEQAELEILKAEERAKKDAQRADEEDQREAEAARDGGSGDSEKSPGVIGAGECGDRAGGGKFCSVGN